MVNMDCSLTGFHVQHTFLLRKEVWNLHARVYATRPALPTSSMPLRRDLFQLNLIYAIACVDSYRKGQSDKHPFGYFTAGLEHLNGHLSFETIEDIQGFLLIARFGLHYYIGLLSSLTSLDRLYADRFRLLDMGNLPDMSTHMYRASTAYYVP